MDLGFPPGERKTLSSNVPGRISGSSTSSSGQATVTGATACTEGVFTTRDDLEESAAEDPVLLFGPGTGALSITDRELESRGAVGWRIGLDIAPPSVSTRARFGLAGTGSDSVCQPESGVFLLEVAWKVVSVAVDF